MCFEYTTDALSGIKMRLLGSLAKVIMTSLHTINVRIVVDISLTTQGLLLQLKVVECNWISGINTGCDDLHHKRDHKQQGRMKITCEFSLENLVSTALSPATIRLLQSLLHFFEVSRCV